MTSFDLAKREAERLTPKGWPRPRRRDKHGKSWPAPWITRVPDFASMDRDRGLRSIEQRLCQVCGEGHDPGADVVIFLDGTLRDSKTYEPIGVVSMSTHDWPEGIETVVLRALDQAIMHDRCAKLAAGACPQLRKMRDEDRLFAFAGPVESITHQTKEGVPTRVYMPARSAKAWTLPERAR
jgi:hypothetical protein